MEEGRKLASCNKTDIETAQNILKYAKDLMTIHRLSWKPPKSKTYFQAPNNWLEELLLLSYRLIYCIIRQPNDFLQTDLPNQFVSLLLYSASQLKQLDVISPLIDQIIQNLMCVDLLIPYFIHIDHFMAVSLLIDAYNEKMCDFTRLISCIYLCKHQNFNKRILPFLDKLEEKYPSEIASIRLCLTITNKSIQTIEEDKEMKNTLLNILDDALLATPENFQILYNAAYIHALLGNKEKAYNYLKQSLSFKPSDGRLILFMIRLLRSNSQPNSALSLSRTAKSLLSLNSKQKKYIEIDTMFAAAEANQIPKAIRYITQLKRDYPFDTDVMSSVIRLNLMINKTKEATETLKEWSIFDKETPEYFFCFSQICIENKDYIEAEKFLNAAIEIDPRNAEFQAALSCLLAKQGKMDQAYERALIALKNDPFYPFAWRAMVNAVNGEEKIQAEDKFAQMQKIYVDLKNVDILLFQEEDVVMNK
ncbi:TPR Domain containing protein [Tritrichomonas foetus]|uniref:TPR Domain containing protein n=1 Tax=Tritrichomonas foetus TaxID=1144522 RepID=A0A1J4KS08_9EUKA|nr:TPR Domain containing protein [Tritrichomonas foetus]|eukprot:OHT13882.1 TPR Domain containing protein [Tritrichomonas foetus]